MTAHGVELYWLPLGAGGHSVRLNGKVFEAVVARLEKRTVQDLYHAALVLTVPEGRFVIEQAPAWRSGAERGVVAEGPVGARWARTSIFRYEIRCWRDGVIPDIEEAVESPQRLSGDVDVAQGVLALIPQVPTPVSSLRSLPIMLTRLRSVGPLPISIAPLSGAPNLPPSIL